MAKKIKKRAKQYDAPLQINGTFDAVIAVAMGSPTQGEEKQQEESKQEKKKEVEKK